MNKNIKYILQVIVGIFVIFIFNFSGLQKVSIPSKLDNTTCKTNTLHLKENHFKVPLTLTSIDSEIVYESCEDDDSKKKNTLLTIYASKLYSYYSERISQNKIKSSSLIYSLSLKNRKRIPLFILFQHWKGYIV